MRSFLKDGGFKGFTTTFEDLHGLRQLPGLAVQRLMADGYGFGAEGDWKTCALLRAMKVMADGLEGGTSFMEDYTYHLHPKGHQVLGAHKRGRGHADLCVFGAEITPNQHKLVDEFVLLDNTYCAGILSAEGHQWSTTAFSTDYMEKS